MFAKDLSLLIGRSRAPACMAYPYPRRMQPGRQADNPLATRSRLGSFRVLFGSRDFDLTYVSVGRSINMESALGERIFMAGRTSINPFLINLSLLLPSSLP